MSPRALLPARKTQIIEPRPPDQRLVIEAATRELQRLSDRERVLTGRAKRCHVNSNERDRCVAEMLVVQKLIQAVLGETR